MCEMEECNGMCVWLCKGCSSDKRLRDQVRPMMQMWCYIYWFCISDSLIFDSGALHLMELISILDYFSFLQTLKVHSLCELTTKSKTVWGILTYTLIAAAQVMGLLHCKCLLINIYLMVLRFCYQHYVLTA